MWRTRRLRSAASYLPRFNVMDADAVRPFVAAVATARRPVTVGTDGLPDATFLPVLWEGEPLSRPPGPCQRPLGVASWTARPRSPWSTRRTPTSARELVRHEGRAREGECPPGTTSSSTCAAGVRVHDDADWVRDLVKRAQRPPRAAAPQTVAVSDAPDNYVTRNLRPIVGVELEVEGVEAEGQEQPEPVRRGPGGCRRGGCRRTGLTREGLVAE